MTFTLTAINLKLGCAVDYGRELMPPYLGHGAWEMGCGSDKTAAALLMTLVLYFCYKAHFATVSDTS